MTRFKEDPRHCYGLAIESPWEEGGEILINLPEHLEYMPETQGILRHHDTNPNGRWTISEDERGAQLDVESPTVPGVTVKGAGLIVTETRVEITMAITNGAQFTLEAIRPLYCLQYRGLKGFPQKGDMSCNYVLRDGAPTPLAEIVTEEPTTLRKGATVRGCDQIDTDFARNHGGLIEDGVDRALVGVESVDGSRSFTFGWTPGKSMLSNVNIPCIHGDPYYGDIAPGETKSAKCVLIFVDGPVGPAFEALAAEGVGLPR